MLVQQVTRLKNNPLIGPGRIYLTVINGQFADKIDVEVLEKKTK